MTAAWNSDTPELPTRKLSVATKSSLAAFSITNPLMMRSITAGPSLEVPSGSIRIFAADELAKVPLQIAETMSMSGLIGIGLIVAVGIFGLYVIKLGQQTRGDLVCSQCGTVGQPQTRVKGSIATEIVLWCFFLLPGLIYSVWRISSKYQACPGCGGATMIPVDSPKGRELTAGK